MDATRLSGPPALIVEFELRSENIAGAVLA